jgi:Tfp pilus assembly protein PilO
MALSLSGEKGTSVFLLLLAALVGYVVYTGTLLDTVGLKGLTQRKLEIAAIQDTVKTLEAQTDSAKKELARGTVEDLRHKLENYRASLALLRRLVPERNEVPNLLDDISTRAKIRGVNLAEVSPLPEERGPAPFTTYKYNIRVMGHYDQIGEFLGDIASLQRIIVPVDLTIAPANVASAKALGDSSGAMLEAKFQIRTYVKSASAAEGEASGT